MPCKHTEDVCQRCLQKVQREDSSEEEEEEEEEEEKYSPQKTNTDKSNRIFFDSAVLVVVGYAAYWNAKLFLKTFDFGVSVVKDILENILH